MKREKMSIEDKILLILEQGGILIGGNQNRSGQNPLYVPNSQVDLDKVMQDKPIEMVICPHPDDAEIGVGAYVAKHAHETAFVFVYITNGINSLVRKPASKLIAQEIFGKAPEEITDEELVPKRKEQSQNAIDFLGIAAGVFLGYSSLKKPHYQEREQIIGAISDMVSELRPQRIFVPQPFCQHPSHLLSTYVAVRAVNTKNDFSGEMLGYYVWGPVPYRECCREEFMIQHYVDQMKTAVRLHKTEAVVDYGTAMECMMRADAIVSKNKPDNPNQRYLQRFMKLDYLRGETPCQIKYAIQRCAHAENSRRDNNHLETDFDAQFKIM